MLTCPHCGKETEQYTIVSSPTQNLSINLTAGCNPIQASYTTLVFDATGKPAQVNEPLTISFDTACANSGLVAHEHYVTL